MRKLIFTLLLVAFTATPVTTLAETVQQLVITLMDKSTQTFWLTDEPIVTFENGELTVTTQYTTYTVERKQLKSFTFSEADAAGIHQLTVVESNVSNRLYDLQGHLLQEGKIDTKNLPAGTYILQTPGKKTMKITRH